MTREKNRLAGVDLLRWMNAQRLGSTTFVYASNRAIALNAEQAMQEGASIATARLITLLDGIGQFFRGLLYRLPFEYMDLDYGLRSKNKIRWTTFGKKLLKFLRVQAKTTYNPQISEPL